LPLGVELGARSGGAPLRGHRRADIVDRQVSTIASG
jgi:hypothetical protein